MQMLQRTSVVAGIERSADVPRLSAVEDGAPLAEVVPPEPEPVVDDAGAGVGETTDVGVMADAAEPGTDVPTEADVPMPDVVPSAPAVPEIRFTQAPEEPVETVEPPAAVVPPAVPQSPAAPTREEIVREHRTSARRTRLGPPIVPPVEAGQETEPESEPEIAAAAAAETPAELLSPDVHAQQEVRAPEPEVLQRELLQREVLQRELSQREVLQSGESESPSLVPQVNQIPQVPRTVMTSSVVSTTSESPIGIPQSVRVLPADEDFDQPDLPSPPSNPPISASTTSADPTQVPTVREVIASEVEPTSVLDTPTPIVKSDVAPLVSRRRLLAPRLPISVAAQPANTSPNQLAELEHDNTFTLPSPPVMTSAAPQAIVAATAGVVPPDQPTVQTPVQIPTQTPVQIRSASSDGPAATQSVPTQNPPTPPASDPFALDQLAADLYDRLRSRLVDELYVGRERAQLLTDL
jgi:hypothetical protein